MPREEGNDWYLPALIVGLALIAFLLGSATTMWLGTAPVPAVARAAALAQGAPSALGENRTPGQTTGSAGSPEGPAQAPAPAPGSTPPAAAETPAASAASPSLAPAASAAPPSSAPAASAAASSAPGPASPVAPQSGDFSLQLGAFLDAAKAKSLADRLAARGYSPASIEAADGYGRTWHYVRLGAFADERAAALAASHLLERVGIGAAVVRLSAANAGR
jgi:cell division protein FtsN